MSDANFGQRMAALHAGRGTQPPHGGRKPIAEKYKKQIDATLRVFADALPDLAATYVDEVLPRDPETCPVHHRILRCSANGCGAESQRRAFNHTAAGYAMDRIMGRPTVRSENAVTVKLVEQLTVAFLTVFEDVNDLSDAAARSQAFGRRCLELSAQFSGTTA